MSPFDKLRIVYDLTCESYCYGAFSFNLTSNDDDLGKEENAVYNNDHRFNNGATGGDRQWAGYMDLDVSSVTDYRYITASIWYNNYTSGGYLHKFYADVYSIYGFIKSDYDGYSVIQDIVNAN